MSQPYNGKTSGMPPTTKTTQQMGWDNTSEDLRQISVANKPKVGTSTKGLKQCYASEMAAGPGNAETVLL